MSKVTAETLKEVIDSEVAQLEKVTDLEFIQSMGFSSHKAFYCAGIAEDYPKAYADYILKYGEPK